MAKSNKVFESIPVIDKKVCIQCFASEVLVGVVIGVYDDAIMIITDKEDIVIVWLSNIVYMWEWKETDNENVMEEKA